MSFEHPTREELRELARLIVEEQERQKRQPQFLDEAAAARMCGLTARTLQEMRYQGTGPYFVKLGTAKQSIIRYPLSELTVWMGNQRRYTSSDEAHNPMVPVLLDLAPNAKRKDRAKDLAGFMEARTVRRKPQAKKAAQEE